MVSGTARTGLPMPRADRTATAPMARSLARLFRHIHINLPRTTTAAGMLMLGAVAAVDFYQLLRTQLPVATVIVPGYFQAYVGITAGLALLALGAMITEAHRLITRIGWTMGAAICASVIVQHVASRAADLPGLAPWDGPWAHPLGTVTVVAAAVFIVIYGCVATGLAAAVPDRL